MREDLISVGDDYWIENNAGDRVYRVNGKAARLRDTWVLEDRQANEVARIHETLLTVRDAIEIEIGDQKATVTKVEILSGPSPR